VDLRRPQMQRNIYSALEDCVAVRQQLNGLGFLEIETPFMTRSTPEGARDYLVPSRVQPGTVLCAAAIAADLQATAHDRRVRKIFPDCALFSRWRICAPTGKPEFTQIDIEMSYPQQPQIFAVVEPMVQEVCKVAGYQVAAPFPCITYAQAIENYGSDKPDMRIPPMYPVQDLLGELANAGLPLVAIHIPACGAPNSQGARRIQGVRTGARPARV